MADDVFWRYIYDSQPPYGWNLDVEFDDSDWLLGRTPIGLYADRFIRTEVYFMNIYLRKTFWVENTPLSAVISIASDDGVEVWINGRKVLDEIEDWHEALYWNYRLMDISSYLNVGENLIAVHVRNVVGACFFDAEITFELKSMEESVFDFVYGRWNPDGGFGDDQMYETFYATSILKTFESTSLLDKDKLRLWILSHKFAYGDFGDWVWCVYPALESLKNIGLELDGESVERLITGLLNWRSEDGSWWNDLHETYFTIEAFASLNALNRTSWEKTISFIKSLQGLDGGFRYRLENGESYLIATSFAIRSLYLLNAVDAIDKNGAVNFIMSCYKNGGFSDRPEWIEWIEPTYWGIKSLAILDLLGNVNPDYVVERVLSWLGDRVSTGNLYGDFCAVMTLKTLNRLYELNKTKVVNNIMQFQNIIDGGFKSESRIYNSEHAIKILSNIGMLEEIDVEKVKAWILSIWSNYPYWSTGDIHSAVYLLTALKASEEINKSEVLKELLSRQCPDGGFGPYRGSNHSNIWETYLAMDTLLILNMTSSLDDVKNRVVNYILSLRNLKGDFNYSRNDRWINVRPTALAVVTLSMLGSIDKIDKVKTALLISEYQNKDGGFGERGFSNIQDTYFSLRALKSLGELNDLILIKAMNYALSLRNLDEGFGWHKGNMWSWLDSTDYATSILYQINVTEYVPFTIRLSEGWNLIGIPLEPLNRSIEAIFAKNLTYVKSIFAYYNDVWYFWLPGIQSTLTEVHPGWGYWVEVSQPFNLTIYGTEPRERSPTPSG